MRFARFVRRWDEDASPPGDDWVRRDLGRRALVPAAWLWLANIAVGLTIVGPLQSLPAEVVVNEELAEERIPELQVPTQIVSNIGGTHVLIYTCVVVVAFLLWRTRQWWFAVVPAIALSVQSAVFTSASFLIGRSRPDVEHLDISPPTSGFPSGHTGASTAFYLVSALLAQRIRHTGLRRALTVLFLVLPLLVGFSRLYRGMHHLTDVTAGLVNGTVCAWLAWRWLRRAGDDEGGEADDDARAADAGRAGRSAPRVAGSGTGVDGVGREPEPDERHEQLPPPLAHVVDTHHEHDEADRDDEGRPRR
ncbi:phosphatase PAP2 family protein [Cellulomonas carbonis]|uniref:Phosphoesterase PA-phosphatase n=1 Tax=Cellulomonas carbonis T26 TaxID=947969 RepID=A0A0A0BYK0_9CELL|nr:phosphatase PAP2 family protein [Cellulomonas carbonis]KGM12722.1 phosphoesterase PA-phosphatase [Cellulomonas carbonis T26]GGC13826.1 hypothetical protein GCM10010972_28980 [Cellulomonas carbonis]